MDAAKIAAAVVAACNGLENSSVQAETSGDIANCIEIQVKTHYSQAMSYNRNLRLRALEYPKEGHSLTTEINFWEIIIVIE